MRDIVSDGSKRPVKSEPKPEKKEKSEGFNIRITRPGKKSDSRVESYFKKGSVERKNARAKFRRRAFYLIPAIVALAIAFIYMNSFAKALVVITPRQEFINVDLNIRASASSAILRDIPLEFVSFEDERELNQAVKSIKTIEARAKGVVVIYNNFSTAAQLLVKGTRLEAPNGNIYRLENNVNVPGAKAADGKMTPQGVEVAVSADQPGETYNIGLTDFNIPGFKGSPRYGKFYGRSKTEITGGFTGSAPIVTEEDLSDLAQKAKAELIQGFKERVKRDLPSGFFLPENAYDLKMEIAESRPKLGERAERISVKYIGKLSGLALEQQSISRFLAENYLKSENADVIRVVNLENLPFEVLEKNMNEKTIAFRIRGRAHFVWKVDEAALKKDLIGKKGERRDVFKSYGGIERAEIKFSPSFWKIFPSDLNRVEVQQIIREG